ncbi:MAG: T3SS (YopN, CesT) and YbjN peptide-binding chaperone 1 [Aeromicrobium sp.]
MDNLDDFDLDRSVQRAWSDFRERLADHISRMVEDENLILSAPEGDEEIDAGVPYVQFCAFGEGAVRCEASSNEFLDVAFQLSADDEQALEDAGWNAPAPDDPHGSPNYFVDLDLEFADQAAAMAVVALRDVFGLAHPTFLDANAWNEEGPVVFDVGREVFDEPDDELPLAVMPADRDELCDLVDRTLAAGFGSPPIKDDDGDIPVRAGSALVFVRVEEAVPIIEIFTPLVRGVTNRTRAAEVLSDLNKDKSFVKFHLNDDYVIAKIQLPAMPFVPQHLSDMLALMSEIADDIDSKLAEELGGRLPFFQDDGESTSRRSSGPNGEEDDLPRELQTLLELDADGTGALSAAEVAKICGHDRDKILAFIRKCSEQEIEWSKAYESALGEGDRDEAAACEHEGNAWAATVHMLRAALRVVVVGNE